MKKEYRNDTHNFNIKTEYKGWTIWQRPGNKVFAQKVNRTSQFAESLSEMWDLIHQEDKDYKDKNIPKSVKVFKWDWQAKTFKCYTATGIDNRWGHIWVTTPEGSTQHPDDLYPMTPSNVAAINRIEELEAELALERKKLTAFDKSYFEEKIPQEVSDVCCLGDD